MLHIKKWAESLIPCAAPPGNRWQQVRGWLVSLLVGLTVLFGPGGVLTTHSALSAPPQLSQHPAPGLTPMTLNQAEANQAFAWGHATGHQETLAAILATAPQGATTPRRVVTLQLPPVFLALLTAQRRNHPAPGGDPAADGNRLGDAERDEPHDARHQRWALPSHHSGGCCLGKDLALDSFVPGPSVPIGHPCG